MCGKLLSLLMGLCPALYGYTGRVTGRDKGNMGRLMLIGKPRWCDVGNCPRARGVGEVFNSCQGSSRRGVVGVSCGVRVQRRRRWSQAERFMS